MKKIYGALAAALFVSGGVFWAACGDDDAVTEKPVTPDGGNDNPPTDSGGNTTDAGDAGPSDCFTDPKTAFEIINACTDAQKITKNPNLPLLQADGGLPTLPQ